MKTLIPISKSLLWVFLSLCLGACFVRPYQFDLYQGNVFTVEKVEQIKPGMSEDQVRYLLGTPMLHDVFHTNRWDYIYVEKPGARFKKDTTRRHIAVYFDNGRVAQVTQDPLPEAVA